MAEVQCSSFAFFISHLYILHFKVALDEIVDVVLLGDYYLKNICVLMSELQGFLILPCLSKRQGDSGQQHSASWTYDKEAWPRLEQKC